MADVSITVDGKNFKAITFTVTPNGVTDGPPVWTQLTGAAIMTVAPDALSARFDGEALVADDPTTFKVEADVNFAPGGTTLITDTGSIFWDFGTGGAPATELGLAAGAPEPRV